jgi:hypothetical protein
VVEIRSLGGDRFGRRLAHARLRSRHHGERYQPCDDRSLLHAGSTAPPDRVFVHLRVRRDAGIARRPRTSNRAFDLTLDVKEERPMTESSFERAAAPV